MPTTRVKLAEQGPAGLNNDGRGMGTRYIPALKFVDWYLSQLPR